MLPSRHFRIRCWLYLSLCLILIQFTFRCKVKVALPLVPSSIFSSILFCKLLYFSLSSFLYSDTHLFPASYSPLFPTFKYSPQESIPPILNTYPNHSNYCCSIVGSIGINLNFSKNLILSFISYCLFLFSLQYFWGMESHFYRCQLAF